jgi:hypothetical protein
LPTPVPEPALKAPEEAKSIFSPKFTHVNKLEVLLAQPDLFEFLEKANKCESQKQFVDFFEAEYAKLHKSAAATGPEPAARVRNAPIRVSHRE